MNADPTLLQLKFARIVTKLARRERIPAADALRFFYHSRLYPLLRDGVADLHCMADEYIVEDLARERRLFPAASTDQSTDAVPSGKAPPEERIP